MSYISTSKEVSTFHWSCHCQLVLSAGCQHPGHGSGARSTEWRLDECRSDALAVATPVATTSDAATRQRRTRLMRSVSSLDRLELDEEPQKSCRCSWKSETAFAARAAPFLATS